MALSLLIPSRIGNYMSVDSSETWWTEMVADWVMLGYQWKVQERKSPGERKAKAGSRFVK